MALLQYGFLPANPLSNTSPSNISSSEKLNYLPPKFKFGATTVRNVDYKDTLKANQVNPKSNYSATPETDSNSHLISIESKNEIEECLYLVNRCNIHRNTHVSEVKQIHARAVKSGVVYSNTSIGNKLVILYSRDSSSLDDARKLFDGIFYINVPTYASLIGSYCRSQRWEDLFSVVKLMVYVGVQPDKFLVPRILKACSALEDLKIGRTIHGYVVRKNLDLDVVVGNSLIDMYSKCGDVISSRRVFDMMPERDVVSWTALISAFMDAGLLDVARDVFESMQLSSVKPDLISWNALMSGFARNGEIDKAIQLLEDMADKGLKPGVSSWNGVISGCILNGYYEDALDVYRKMSLLENPNAVTIASILPACSGLCDLTLGKLIHSYALKHQILGNIFVAGSLIDMYSKCGRSDYAWRAFMGIEQKNIVVWNEMIAAYVNEGKMREAKELLSLMQNDGLKPDAISYNTILAAYAREGQKDEAFELLSEMGKMGLKPNIVSLNVLISGFQQSGLTGEALKLFRAMQSPTNTISNVIDSSKVRGCLVSEPLIVSGAIQPNPVSVTSALAACADLKSWRHGKEIHGHILRIGLKPNTFVLSALVDMYAKCHDMDSAVKLFYSIEDKSTVTWNILMDGWRNNKDPKETLRLFPEMMKNGHTPSSVTSIILLSACSYITSLRMGKKVHAYIVKSEFRDSAITLASALIDMYANCGSIIEARLVFDSQIRKDIAIWNAMISGYSIHGMGKEAVALFEQLVSSPIVPDNISFTALLSAFIRDGLLEEGWKYFNLMEGTYGIKPNLEHYTCMIGIMGSRGLLVEALDFMGRIPYKPDACAWATLLRACRVHSNPEIGEMAAKALFELEPNNASNYILLSNIYAMVGMWESVRNVRSVMRGRGLMSVNEWSSIDVVNAIHTFKGGESLHPKLDKILEMWDKLASKMDHDGYFPLHPVFKDEREPDLFSCLHTEKIAICFGIITLITNSPIRILKNVRMCIDCHSSAKYISRIEEREIFVRDGCVYHHFKDGICSCQDRW